MNSIVKTYRYGSPRSRDELLRVGVTRHVPRGVRREDWQRKNYFDVWVPLLAPSAELLAENRQGKLPFAEFARRYETEMKNRESRQVIELLAALVPFQTVSVGCFCEDETTCHRTLLKKLIEEEARARGAAFAALQEDKESVPKYVSPVCYAELEAEEAALRRAREKEE